MKESQRRADEQTIELRAAIAQLRADAKGHEASVTEALLGLTSLVSRALGEGGALQPPSTAERDNTSFTAKDSRALGERGALQPSTAERDSTSFTASGGSTLPPSRRLPSEKPRGVLVLAGAPLASRSLAKGLLASRSHRKLLHKPDVHFAADVESVTEGCAQRLTRSARAACASAPICMHAVHSSICAHRVPCVTDVHAQPVEHPSHSHPLRERTRERPHDETRGQGPGARGERPLDEMKHDAQNENDTNHAQNGSGFPSWLSSLGSFCQASPHSLSRSQHLSGPSTLATSSSDNYVA